LRPHPEFHLPTDPLPEITLAQETELKHHGPRMGDGLRDGKVTTLGQTAMVHIQTHSLTGVRPQTPVCLTHSSIKCVLSNHWVLGTCPSWNKERPLPAQWLTPIILAKQRSGDQSLIPAWAKSETSPQKYPIQNGAGHLVQVMECPPSKYEALSSNPSMKGRKEGKKGGREGGWERTLRPCSWRTRSGSLGSGFPVLTVGL
jgi:hypothetical protein